MKSKVLYFCCGFTYLATVLISCGSKNRQIVQELARTYPTMTISLENKTVTNKYSASIKGQQDIGIYPQISGTINRICVTEGQQVKKGQKLFVIEQGTYLAALNQATANSISAEVSLANSQLTYNSKQRLYNDSIISKYELQTAHNALANAEADLAQAQAQEASAKTSYNYTTITSPADGVVGDLPYFQGDLVSPSISKPLTTISNNTEMFVYFSITENELLELYRKYGSIKRALKGMPEVLLQLSDGTEYSLRGRIESISGVVDKSTGSTSLRARFPNPNGLLHSGFSGNIILPYTYKDCIVIPQAATTEIQDKVIVYKVVNGKTQSSQVQVIPTDNGNEYIATYGLSENDTIISNGAGLLRDGINVGFRK